MKIYASTGPFAGDKDAAAYIRTTYVRRGIERGEQVILDFANVQLATQSFIHALIADVVRSDASCLEHIEFKNCNVEIQTVIEIVVAYAQEWSE